MNMIEPVMYIRAIIIIRFYIRELRARQLLAITINTDVQEICPVVVSRILKRIITLRERARPRKLVSSLPLVTVKHYRLAYMLLSCLFDSATRIEVENWVCKGPRQLFPVLDGP